MPERWPAPVFPLGGRDALSGGVAHGPAIGRLLRSLEAWWIDQDFAPDEAALRDRLPHDVFARVRLVITGRYDAGQPDVRATQAELERLTRALGVGDHVRFELSPPDATYAAWLDRCQMVVFTPEAEHLGIVPLEAMAAAHTLLTATRWRGSHGRNLAICRGR